jgi:uncharacterized RDD family membrane protein YckC
VVYESLLVALLGCTLGKLALGLRVVDLTGRRASWITALVRSLALLVSVIVLGLGVWWTLFDRTKRGLHDHLAGTYVIRRGRSQLAPG